LPERNAFPFTDRLVNGEVVPIPTLPLAAIERRAKPDVESNISKRPAPLVLLGPVEMRSKTCPPLAAFESRRMVPVVDVESIESKALGLVVPIPTFPEE